MTICDISVTSLTPYVTLQDTAVTSLWQLLRPTWTTIQSVQTVTKRHLALILSNIGTKLDLSLKPFTFAYRNWWESSRHCQNPFGPQKIWTTFSSVSPDEAFGDPDPNGCKMEQPGNCQGNFGSPQMWPFYAFVFRWISNFWRKRGQKNCYWTS